MGHTYQNNRVPDISLVFQFARQTFGARNAAMEFRSQRVYFYPPRFFWAKDEKDRLHTVNVLQVS